MAAPHIGLLVTGPSAVADFQIFVKTLEVWHPDAHLYIFTDSDTESALKGLKTRVSLQMKVALDAYKGKTRAEMEASPGHTYDSLFKDYTYEKAAVLEWMWEVQPSMDGAWFMDADITHLAPLPAIPDTASIALSPHYIREADCVKFGVYNAGYMWIKDRELVKVWRAAAAESRFFEQAALEVVADAAGTGLYKFPIQVNFGWWRMFQSPDPPHAIMSKFTIYRPDKSVGIRFENKTLQSIHTHWTDTSRSAAGVFNSWFNDYTSRFTAHKPLANLRRTLGMR